MEVLTVSPAQQRKASAKPLIRMLRTANPFKVWNVEKDLITLDMCITMYKQATYGVWIDEA